jgi:predicted NBD/HSP70 family sugar kinase
MTASAAKLGRLAERQVPALVCQQIERFTLESLQAKPVRTFDAAAALHTLRRGSQTNAIAVDIGGDKLVWSSFEARDGLLLQPEIGSVSQGDGGSGYLQVLEHVADIARRKMFPVGISLAGPTDGSRLLASPNLPVFLADLHAKYGGDFSRIFPAVQLANDAEAGIIAGALEAVKRYPMLRNVLYIINGSGLGGAVLNDNVIYAAEPGHVEVDVQLNPFKQRKVCGMFGASHVCVEVVAASKAGIEDIWFQQKGHRISGKEIAIRYLNGDHTAIELYDYSAVILAHVINGIARAFGLSNNFERTVVVGHGGIFEVPGYRERLRSILAASLPITPRMLFTRDFSTNACLEGAAIAALVGNGRGLLDE